MCKLLSKVSLALLVLLSLASCTNEVFLPTPQTRNQAVIDELQRTTWNPQNKLTNLKASQGKWRTITLTWDPVPGAVRYDVYKSDKPAGVYTPIDFSVDTSLDLSVAPGTDAYFKVAAVSAEEKLGELSLTVRGTSLAQPIISGIVEPEGAGAGQDATVVYWFMNNIGASTYEGDVRYRVSAFEGIGSNTLVSQVTVEGRCFVEVGGLKPLTPYDFQVEAWFIDEEAEPGKPAPGKLETSGRMDKETARRISPTAPADLRTVPGGEAERITLYFTLPGKVDVLVDEIEHADGTKTKLFEERGLYFKILRDGELVDELHFLPYPEDDDASNREKTWSDTIATANRGIEYSYEVQAFTEGVTIQAPVSKKVTGWAMAKPKLEFGTLSRILNSEGDQYAAADLLLALTHTTRNIAYEYVLFESVSPVGDVHTNNVDAAIPYREIALDPPSSGIDGENTLSSYALSYDLTGKTTETFRGRGFYTYAVDVYLGTKKIERVYTPESKLIIENTEEIKVKNLEVADGYANKFILTWDWEENRSYVVKSRASASDDWEPIAAYPVDFANAKYPAAGVATRTGEDLSYTVTISNPGYGLTCDFSVQPYLEVIPGDAETIIGAQTLGTAQPVLGAVSYSWVEIEWAPVQKATSYVLKYWYGGNESDGETKNLSGLSLAQNKYTYTLKPRDSENVIGAKKSFSVVILAKNDVDETSSEAIPHIQVFNPRNLTVDSTTADTLGVNDIKVTWNTVEGALGYYIIRRQLKPDNSGSPTKENTDVRYYVNVAASTPTIKGLKIITDGGLPADTVPVGPGNTTLPFEISPAGDVFILTDKVLTDTQVDAADSPYTPLYAGEQNAIAWGYPYQYTVVPVLKEADTPTVNYADDASWIIGDQELQGIAAFSKTGHTLGFVHDVTVTKGTGHANSSNTNDRITISWTKPALAPAAVAYNIYRRPQGSSVWTKITSTAIASGLTSYSDESATVKEAKGEVFEYLVGLDLVSKELSADPTRYVRFVDAVNGDTGASADTEPRATKIAGYILPSPSITATSPKTFADSDGIHETVNWNAVKVGEVYNWGIAGYEIQVKNASFPGSPWQKIADASAEGSTLEKTLDDLNLLQVTRDYKHYYRVLAYALDGTTRYYSTLPEDSAAPWATRKITTKKEATAAAAIAIASGIYGQKLDANDANDTFNVSIDTVKRPIFTGVSGSLKVCSNDNHKTLGIIFSGNRNIFAYGATVSNTTVTPNTSSVTLTSDTEAGKISIIATISNLRDNTTSSGAFSADYGAGTADPKDFEPVFSFGAETANTTDVNNMVWSPTEGWNQ
jgi:hypothetical protein